MQLVIIPFLPFFSLFFLILLLLLVLLFLPTLLPLLPSFFFFFLMSYFLFISFLVLLNWVQLLECWVTVDIEGLPAVAPVILGKLTASLPRVLLPAISCSLPGVPLSTNFKADSSPKFGKSELHLWLALLGESQRAFQCCMDHIFNFKYLTVVSLSRSPGLSLGPAGLRIQDPCQVPWVQVASAGALCLRVGAPAGRFALDNWPSNAVRIASSPSTFFLLAYLYI